MLIMVSYDQLEAHGGVTQFEKRQVGPYEIQFGTSPGSPSPGKIHVSLRIASLETGLAINGKSVHVSGQIYGEDGSIISFFEPVPAVQFMEDPIFWDLDLQVSEVGDWILTVTVEGDNSIEQIDFEIKIQESSPLIGIFSVIGLILFLCVLALVVRTYFKPKVKSV